MYTLLLVALSAGLVYAISQRMPLELDIIRDRNSLYRETNDGLVENVYTLKVINMDEKAHRYSLRYQANPRVSKIWSSPLMTRLSRSNPVRCSTCRFRCVSIPWS